VAAQLAASEEGPSSVSKCYTSSSKSFKLILTGNKSNLYMRHKL
jgi:hypothetical protein